MKIFLISLCLALFLSPVDGKEARAKLKPVFAATVNGHRIELFINYGVFDPEKRKVERVDAKGDDGEVYKQILVQGKQILGTDNGEPGNSEIIESMTVVWDGKRQEVPQDLFDHIVNPHRGTDIKDSYAGILFIVDPKGEVLLVDMGYGDGGGAGGIQWRFSKNGPPILCKGAIHNGG